MNNNSFPVISNLNISKYLAIKNISLNLPSHKQWLFLKGDIGSGKTTLMKSIAIALSNADDFRKYLGLDEGIEDTGHFSISVDDDLKIKNSPDNAMKIMSFSANNLGICSAPITKDFSSCASLFEDAVLLRNIGKEGLSRWYFNPNYKKRFRKSVEIIKWVIPKISDITIDEEFNTLYQLKDIEGYILPPVTFSNLPSGHQKIISIIGSIILNSNYFDNKNDKAIVLIDDFELFFNNRGQSEFELPYLLGKAFPNILFIASTYEDQQVDNTTLSISLTKQKGITITN
jgi:predicted ATP-binding protein involved in virulence